MKTINLLTSHFLPEISPCTNRVLPFIHELQKHYKVNVISLTEKGVSLKNEHVVNNNRVDFYYVNQKDFNGKNFFVRGWYELIYTVRLIRLANSIESDGAVISSPYMFMIPVAGLGIRGKKVLDNRDLVWEYLDEKSLLERLIKHSLKLVMRLSMKLFDHVMVTNDYEARILSEDYGMNEVDIVTNGIAAERYDKLSRIERKQEEPFTITYVGNVGLAQNLRVFVDAAKSLPDIRFLVIGDGVDMPSIREHVQQNRIENVDFTGKIEWEELEHYYRATMILYTELDEKFSAAMPSKLYEYASTGLPIIYGGIGQAVTFVEKLENATIIRPNDVEALVDAIIQMRGQSLTISQKNRELVESHYIREVSAQKVVRAVQRLVGT